MENATIEQLSGAVTQLMEAYETLQTQYNDVKNENRELKATVETLTSSKNELESNVDNLTNNKEEQSTQVNSMLGKIEMMLMSKEETSVEVAEEVHQETLFETQIEQTEETNDSDVADLTSIPEVEETKIDPTKQLDLGRMNDLLGGFNK